MKKLDGTKFEIEVNPQDTVADLKNNIETVLGYPAANQILVHQGQLLNDRTVLEEDNNVAENSVIVMMVSPRVSEQGGLPASAGTMVVHRPAKPVQATQLPAVLSSVLNANSLNLFPQDLPTAAGAAINLYFLTNNLRFLPNNLGFLRDERHVFTYSNYPMFSNWSRWQFHDYGKL